MSGKKNPNSYHIVLNDIDPRHIRAKQILNDLPTRGKATIVAIALCDYEDRKNGVLNHESALAPASVTAETDSHNSCASADVIANDDVTKAILDSMVGFDE